MNMKRNHLLISVTAAILAVAAIGAEAQAEDSRGEEAKELHLFNQAAISLSDAIKAAEQKTGGKVLEAELDDDSSTPQFEVEVVKDGRIHEVLVDGKTGAVLKVSLENNSDENDSD
ncbi:PepSY domain-containing protein [Candidatus Methylomicrobium oryzae]|uniref:PepSY domain-containing protein n=1 Tax=Candidatus Methylomicrobium oryzae TaxID=2802053 RepID=UPI0019242CBA|nr:PepSY domain-containing protein [Methylomicrobium sp. RS1]MBL1262747.1 PepSY domain-containing protein [Methylomicrobium sp. RS1]